MTFRIIALLALASGQLPCAPAVAVYYSFDQPPARSLVAAMQVEFARIFTTAGFEPAGVPVEWRAIGDPEDGNFADIFVVRFRGSCSMETGGKPEPALKTSERALARTSVTDGRVLPFAEVECDLLRRYLSPGFRIGAEGEFTMARALARVTAHEIYHMLTGSVRHCAHGIGQAEFSPRDLTADRFVFGANESAWLRNKSASLSSGLDMRQSAVYMP